MTIYEIMAILIFFSALSSWRLVIKEGRTSPADRMPMFRSEIFCAAVSIFSILFVVGSGIILFLYSWKVVLLIFIASGIVYPALGKPVAKRLLGAIYYVIDSYTRRRLNKKNKER